MNLPNKITVTRVLLVIPLVILLLFSFDVEMRLGYLRWWALGVFLLASLTDFLDGYLARKLNAVTNFGKFMDPLADKLMISSALVCISASKEAPWWMTLTTIIVIAREFIVSGFRMVAAEQGKTIAASILGKVKTVFQIVFVAMAIADLPFEWYKVALLVMAIAVVFITLFSGWHYIMDDCEVIADK